MTEELYGTNDWFVESQKIFLSFFKTGLLYLNNSVFLLEDAAAEGLRRRVVHLESVVLHRAVRHEPLMKRNAIN